MKPFVFSLERMRNYKDQVLNKEKEQLAKLQKEKAYVEETIEKLKNYRSKENEKLKLGVNQSLSASEISGYNFFMNNTKHQIEALQKELIVCEGKVEKQLQIVIEASKDRNGLDKLEEKQLEEYKMLEAKENEIRISEHVTISMVRKKLDNVSL